MNNAPANYQDDECTWEEWQAIPKETRTAIVSEHGYRKRPSPKPVAITATRAPSKLSVVVNPAGNAASARIAEYLEKAKDPAFRARVKSFGEYCDEVGWPIGSNEPTRAHAPRPAIQTEDGRLPVEERAAATWRVSPDLRREFGEDYARYLGFRKAEARGVVPRERTSAVVKLSAEEIEAIRRDARADRKSA